jgi:hypothetical protein
MPRTSIRLQQIWNWPSEAMWHENTSSFESSEAQLSVVGFVEDDSFCLGSCAALFVAMLDGLANIRRHHGCNTTRHPEVLRDAFRHKRLPSLLRDAVS